MATANEELQQALISHQVYLQRYSSSVVSKIIALLNRADADLIEWLEVRLAKIAAQGYDSGPKVTERFEAILKDLRVKNRAAYDLVGKELTEQLRDFAAYETKWTQSTVSSVLPEGVTFTSIPVRTVAAAALSRPFQGRLLSEALSGLEVAKAAKVRDAIRIGMVEGQTVDQMVRTIRGTRANGYADGLLEVTRRDAAAVVRTAVNHVGNYAREALYAENTDIIAKVQWHATLDGRTCPVCGGRDGKTWDIGKNPKAPAHYGCRCVIVPVTKSWRDLGIDIDEMSPGTRASMNGQVPATVTYGDWLAKQSAQMQDEVLGPTRGKLFRKGGLSIDRFTDRSGNDLTLDQLRQKVPEAFERAGVPA